MKRILTVIVALLAIAIILVMALIAVMMVKTLTLTADSRQDHVGVEFFEEKEYLNYKYGDAFEAMLEELYVLEKGNVVNFYHTDNSWADFTLFAGAPHIFAVDVKIDQDTYTVSDILLETQAKSPVKEFDYIMHYVPRQEDEVDLYIIATCEDSGIVRYIYISEVTSLASYYSGLIRYSALDWNN